MRQEISGVRLCSLIFTPLCEFGHLWQCNRSQNTNDCDDDHQLDQRKAPLPLHMQSPPQ